MSFSFDTKFEICESIPKNECCKASMLYGMVLFAQQLSLEQFKLSTENVVVVNVLNDLANSILNFNFNIDESSNGYFAQISDQRLKLLFDKFYIDVCGKINYSISSVITEKKCCCYSFLKGAFLSGGYIANPENRYHFEISTSYYSLAKSLESFMQRLGFPAKSVVRKASYVVYMKDSEQIENFLCYIGANAAAFSIMNVKISKEMNNYSNRLNNTKLHNIEKTLNKSVEQVKAIMLIQQKVGFDFLQDDLVEIAKLRLQYPDKSLNELVLLCGNKYSRSGLNRRFNKLIELASKIQE